MRYVARVTFTITTFVECEGDDLLIGEAVDRLGNESIKLGEKIRQQTKLFVKDHELSEISGRPVNDSP